MTKIRLVNTAGTPITRVGATLQAVYEGYNTENPSKVVTQVIPLKSSGFENGKVEADLTIIPEMDVVKKLSLGADIEDRSGFYKTTIVNYKVSKECGKNPKYVDYASQIGKLKDEKEVLDAALEKAKEAGDAALVATLKEQLAEIESSITRAEELEKAQSEDGIEPTICVMDGIPLKVSIPLKQITRTPEQLAERRQTINTELVAAAVKKVKD